MEKLSVTIITLNEEDYIRDALESIKWADEIVVVDSGSTDKTLDICREYTDKVYSNKWPGFVAQKNFATDKASHRWILSIDADERVTAKLAEEIRGQLSSPQADAYYFPRRVFYLGRWINYSGWYPDFKVRLFDRKKCRWEGKYIHESVKVNGHTEYFKADLAHYTYKDISHHVRTMNSFTSISAREYYEKGKSCGLSNILFRPPFTFMKKYILKQGFRDGLPGFIIAVSTAYYVFLKYVKLWELKNIKDCKESGK